jgi:hypothetical protein
MTSSHHESRTTNPISGPEQWQTSFVRYSCDGTAAPADSWSLEASRRRTQPLLDQDPCPLAPGYAAAVGRGAAPMQLSMRIIEAPAELCVPIRTDK